MARSNSGIAIPLAERVNLSDAAMQQIDDVPPLVKWFGRESANAFRVELFNGAWFLFDVDTVRGLSGLDAVVWDSGLDAIAITEYVEKNLPFLVRHWAWSAR